MRATDYGFRVRTKLPVIAKQRFYDDTFLNAASGPVLFILDAALVEGKRGRYVRAQRDVLQFPTEQAMLSAVVSGGWRETPVEDRDWRPTADVLLEVSLPVEEDTK